MYKKIFMKSKSRIGKIGKKNRADWEKSIKEGKVRIEL